ncbi:MAG: hypothetical protein OXI87_16890 [Albidovulum sp.]|nr:hypothetical protein [Albidovulum sp.]MDE0531208.1 hypothetical protein [Albidovulum sp.]
MENVFVHLKSCKLANRVFDAVEEVREAVIEAWTGFAGRSDRIGSAMTREWADFSN